MCVAAFVSVGLVSGRQAEDDVLQAMRAELQRTKSLQAGDVGAPYYVEYALDDVDSYEAVASMGGTLVARRSRARVPRVEVRVGDYKFDNTNYPGGAGRGGGSLPIESDTAAIRRGFWLITDSLYKNAVEALTRKKTALMNVTQQETLNDFAKAEPVTRIQPLRKMEFKDDQWRQTAVALSAIFKDYPVIVGSLVTVQANYSNSYYVNSEGSAYRFGDDLFTFRVTASAQAKDGMPITEGASLLARTPGGWAPEAEMRRVTTEVAKDIAALVNAPMGESYAGPVLVEGVASAQLLAQLIGPNLSVARRVPGGGAGRGGGRGGGGGQATAGEWEGRVGARVLPDWMDVVDDPTLESYKGHELLGYYPLDMEAVAPKPVTLVERGVLKNYLLTRQPVSGYEGSNGHGRLPGANGAKQPAFGNLFIQAREKVSEADLKRQFLDLVRQRGKAYGLIVRRIDFPQTGAATGTRLRAGATAVAAPLLVYKVFPDGREELVRGLSFASINLRGLRDITAASDQEHIFEYTTTGGNYIVGQSVIAPSILFEDMELDRREADWPKPPFVPPPAP
jgi:predicted Zn-dependent protease